MGDIHTIKTQFSILNRTVHGKPLVYLDNAATTQKPQRVLDALQRFYTEHNANIHRGVHLLSQEATEMYEVARERVRKFINAKDAKEIIFVRGTTEAINLVATSFGQSLKAGDEIVISHMEHHSNIVPWQMLCERMGAVLKILPLTPNGELDHSQWDVAITERTKLVSVTHISNAIGTVNPVKELIAFAHSRGARVMIDGAQAVSRLQVDVQDLDADFYAFSGHKMYGPTGIGVLYGKAELLDAMPPYQGGGDMIYSVSFEKTTYAPLPAKFEAGTPAIAEAVVLAEACDFIEELGFDDIQQHERELLEYLDKQLKLLDGVRVLGHPQNRAGACSFVIDDIHPHDIGTILDSHGVAVRTGQHCCEPLMQFFGVAATSRISLGVYTTREDIDAAIAALQEVLHMFRS